MPHGGKHPMDDKLIAATEAGRILNKSAESARVYERKGILRALKTARGMRLFREADVRELAAKQMRPKEETQNSEG